MSYWLLIIRSIESSNIQKQPPEVFCKKGVLRSFTKFTGKHLCQSPFFNIVAGVRPATPFKKRLWHRYFPVNFMKFLRTSFYIEHLWWLLLNIHFAVIMGSILKVLRKFSLYVRRIHETNLWRMNKNGHFKIELSPSKKIALFNLMKAL